ncbi:HEAT repeat domain-containing protein [Halorubrum cibi]|uniref:HEAT repeat n=1 Tax=Halorubrum cibi TaxID=413815 RepID=A0A521F1H0_9EURY|nr:HEAT repeat domain-containing protein [Halorubrum cibi]SMO90035.1 HEAT repeat [Halorubrum cibi]
MTTHGLAVPVQVGFESGVVLDDLTLTTILTAMAVVLGALLIATGGLTIGRSVTAAVRRRRRGRVRKDIQAGLYDRLYRESSPEWDAWVDGLSRVERTVAESLLKSNLRNLRGDDAERLRGLGVALGIPERSRRRLNSSRLYVRLRALTWLTLLEMPTNTMREGRYRPEDPRERAAVARVLYPGADEADAPMGVDLLLEGATEAFTPFGIDTLYRFGQLDREALHYRAEREATRWSPELLTQVLLIVQKIGGPVDPARLGWIVDLLDHDSPDVRAGAARALGVVGWDVKTQQRVPVDRVLTDESSHVRSAGYEMLGEWGDDEAVARLRTALERETNDRAILEGARALHGAVGRENSETVPPVAQPAWQWVAELREFDARARQTAIDTDESVALGAD